MDIKSAELGALKGIIKLLKKDDTTIFMEFHPPSIEEYGAKPKEIYDFMTSLGYDIKVSSKDSLSFEELEKIAIDNAGTNILYTAVNHKK